MHTRTRPLALAFAAVLLSLHPSMAGTPTETEMLKAGGPKAEALIEKAHTAIAEAQIFAPTAVGYAGSPTVGCWALTVIVKHDPKAREFLDKVYATSPRPAARLYAAAGLLKLDPSSKSRFDGSSVPQQFRTMQVQGFDGCERYSETFGIALATLVKNGGGYYLYDKLPAYEPTVGAALPPVRK